jgi:hypothetical protein
MYYGNKLINMKVELAKYINLIKGFVDGGIAVQDFEKQYLQLVKGETFVFDEDISKVIETLFSDVDSYCGNPEIANYNVNEPFANIDENELKRRSENALKQLLRIN